MSGSDPNFVMTGEAEAPKSADQLRRQALRLLQQGASPSDRPDHANGPQDFASESVTPPASPAPARAFMIGVVTMPAVFLVVVMGALAMFGKPAAVDNKDAAIAAVETLAQPSATPATQPTLASARPANARKPAISLGEDMRIADISLDGDRVALHIESPMGQEILIYDYAKGRVVAEAPIETASIDAVDALAMLTGAPQPAPKPVVIAAVAPAPEATPAAAEASQAVVAATPRIPALKPRGTD